MTKQGLMKLLLRMRPDDGSAGIARWLARKQAERLDDPKLLPLLREVIEENPEKEHLPLRGNAYLVMTSLLRQNPDPACCQFLADRTGKESDKYILFSLLNGIARLRMPPEVRMDAVAAKAQSETWLVRQSAIRALAASSSPCCLEAARKWAGQTDEKKYGNEITYACAALGEIGLTEDIPLLERHLNAKTRDVRDAARFAVGRIRERNGEAAQADRSEDTRVQSEN